MKEDAPQRLKTGGRANLVPEPKEEARLLRSRTRQSIVLALVGSDSGRRAREDEHSERG